MSRARHPATRWLGAVMLVTAAVCASAVLGIWTWLRSSLPNYSGTVTVADLTGAVEVIRDRRAVPHIYAQTLNDAFLALGYAHAQDRLFFLEFYRLQSQGRLAEILGPIALESDRFIRMAGRGVSKARILAALTEQERGRLAAYAAGVNAYLDGQRGALPPEFIYLGTRPGRWSVVDAARLGVLTSFDRDGWRSALLRLQLQARLPVRIVDAILKDYADADLADLRLLARSPSNVSATASLRTDNAIALRLPHLSVASNAWAVAPARSVTGGALFAADPHMDLVLPSIYTPVHLVTPELEFAGFAIPGEAALVGQSQFMAWGMTHAAAFTTSLVIETIDEATQRYRAPDGWRPLKVTVETIAVRGQPPQRMVIRETDHGPIVSDHLMDAREAARTLGAGRALVVSGLNPTGGAGDAGFIASTQALALGHSLDDVDGATDRYLGVDNLIVADRNGNISVRTLVPTEQYRPPDTGQATMGDRSPLDGEANAVNVIALLPQVTNPPCGVVFNANELLVDGPRHCEPSESVGFRPVRLRAQLAATDLHSIETFRHIQLDTVSDAARALLPTIRAIAPRNVYERRAQDYLRQWDGSTDLESVGALIFHQWLREIDTQIVGDNSRALGIALPHVGLHVYVRMLTKGSVWCTDLRAGAPERTCEDVAQIAFERCVQSLRRLAGDDIAGWKWGRFHEAIFEHPLFSHVFGLRWFGERRVPIPGGGDTINAAASNWDPQIGFPVTHAALTRRLEDLKNPERSLLAFAAGVSGNPLSRYYDDQLAPWAQGEYFSIGGPREQITSEAIGITKLLPKRDRHTITGISARGGGR